MDVDEDSVILVDVDFDGDLDAPALSETLIEPDNDSEIEIDDDIEMDIDGVSGDDTVDDGVLVGDGVDD